jgi:hypothetical protein
VSSLPTRQGSAATSCIRAARPCGRLGTLLVEYAVMKTPARAVTTAAISSITNRLHARRSFRRRPFGHDHAQRIGHSHLRGVRSTIERYDLMQWQIRVDDLLGVSRITQDRMQRRRRPIDVESSSALCPPGKLELRARRVCGQFLLRFAAHPTLVHRQYRLSPPPPSGARYPCGIRHEGAWWASHRSESVCVGQRTDGCFPCGYR